MTRYALVVNPNSGNGRTGKRWKKYEKIIRSILGDDLVIRFTSQPGEGIDLAREFINEGEQNILACGGDGTLNEVSNAAVGREDVNVGFVPLGNSNDQTRNHGIPNDLKGALEVIKQGRIRRLGVGRISDKNNGRFFIDMTDMGLSAMAAKAAHTEAKWLKGDLKYTYLVLKYLIKHKNIPLTLSINGEEPKEVNVTLLAAGMGEIIAGFKLLPGNSYDHEDFAVLVASDYKRREIPPLLIKALKGTHINEERIEYQRAKKVEIFTDQTIVFELEGEIWENDSNHITIEYIHNALNRFVP